MDCRLLTLPEIARLYRSSQRTIEYIIRRDPTFPKPLRVSRRRLWVEADILGWLASRRAA